MSRIVTVHLTLCLLVVAIGRVTARAAAYTEGIKTNDCCHSLGNDRQYEDIPKHDSVVIELGQTDDRDIHTSDAE